MNATWEMGGGTKNFFRSVFPSFYQNHKKYFLPAGYHFRNWQVWWYLLDMNGILEFN